MIFHFYEFKKSARRVRVIFNSSTEDQKTTNMGEQELRVQELTKLVGIRRVLELISGKHLPLIGFELMNDIMFLYHWCIDKLPETCSEFLRRLRTDFPLIVDVRVHVSLRCNSRTFFVLNHFLICFLTLFRSRMSTKQ